MTPQLTLKHFSDDNKTNITKPPGYTSEDVERRYSRRDTPSAHHPYHRLVAISAWFVVASYYILEQVRLYRWKRDEFQVNTQQSFPLDYPKNSDWLASRQQHCNSRARLTGNNPRVMRISIFTLRCEICHHRYEAERLCTSALFAKHHKTT